MIEQLLISGQSCKRARHLESLCLFIAREPECARMFRMISHACLVLVS